MEQKPIRYHLLDEIRGGAIICMVVFHLFFTVCLFSPNGLAIDLINFFTPVQPLFALLFIFLSGFCGCLSSSNLKRGLKLFCIALLFTLATYFLSKFDIISTIDFGILHLLSVSMILWGLFEKLNLKVNLLFCAIIFFVLFLVTYYVPDQQKLAFVVDLPESLFSNRYLAFLGFPPENYFSDDYYPLIPWLFAFFGGGFFGKYLKQRGFPKFLEKKRVGFLGFIGRHSLLIYIVHQPIIFGICLLIDWIF